MVINNEKEIKMNKKNLLLALATAMMMGGISKTSAAENSDVKTSKPDTLLVVGIWNQPNAYATYPKKHMLCVDKQAKKHEIAGYVFDGHGKKDPVVPYVERGDTVVVQDGKVVKNLTMDRMIKNYVNGR